MVKPCKENNFNRKPPREGNENPRPYIVATFEPVDLDDFERFQSRLITMIKEDENASFTRALMALRECLFFKMNHSKEADIQDYGQALVERFSYPNASCEPPAGYERCGDPLLEALYHAAVGFDCHMDWARRVRVWYPADYVHPRRHPLRTRDDPA
jgi:hypothetical protein